MWFSNLDTMADILKAYSFTAYRYVEEDGSVIAKKLPWPDEWMTTICIPDYEYQERIAKAAAMPSSTWADAEKICSCRHFSSVEKQIGITVLTHFQRRKM